MNNFLKFVDSDEGGYLYLFLLFIFIFLITYPMGLSPNEENYFQLAYKRIHPEEFPLYHSIFDKSNARYLSELVIGFLIHNYGYEITQTILKITIAFLFSFSAKIYFESINISFLIGLGVIAIFYLTGQQIFGGEWIFGGIEPKTLSYPFVICALGYGFKSNWRISTLLVIAATYFHFLIGGFWFLVLTLISYLKTKKIHAPFKMSIIYLITILPLITIIIIDQLSGINGDAISKVNEIYAMRVSHHVEPFLNLNLLRNWSGGMILGVTLILFLFMTKIYAKNKILVNITIILLIYLYCALVISYLDRQTYMLAKFYLFRPSSLILLLGLSAIVSIVNDSANTSTRSIYEKSVICIIVFVVMSRSLTITSFYYKNRPSMIDDDVISLIDKYSKPSEIVLIEPYKENLQPYVGLHRKINRPTLISWKFIPTNPQEILRWNDLLQYRNKLFSEGCTSKLQYPIRILLVFNEYKYEKIKNCGKVIKIKDNMSLVILDRKLYDS